MEPLIIGVIIGAVYGRNYRAINQRTYQDACKAATVLMNTQMGVTTIFVLETIVRALDKPEKVSCMRNVMCECQRRHCPGRTVSIGYYASKIKGAL